MFNLFGEQYLDVPKKFRKRQDPRKRAWENAFQKWINEKAQNGYTHYGACGYGAICEYCDDNSKGRPCVRALNAMCRSKRLSIDYTRKNFEECFDGEVRDA